MKIAIVASNYVSVNKDIARGPEVFTHTYLWNLAKYGKEKQLEIVVFASGNSNVPFKLESVNYLSSLEDPDIGIQHHKLFELALFSKAFSQQDQFDLYHVTTGDERAILPFMPFVRKPVLFTLHTPLAVKATQKFHALFTFLKNVFFVSISNSQRKPIPNLNYIKTIYHGIDLNEFSFGVTPEEFILWMGRGNPEKGVDVGLEVARQIDRNAEFYIAQREKHVAWLEQLLEKKGPKTKINLAADRNQAVSRYQYAKLFLFPIQWEEPFGLVMIESMACGTPVVAYARGSVPEIIKDGETGFIVNSSPDDVRGDWIVKKTGIEGLCEAVERIYSMPEEQYKQMRKNCRAHVEKNFTVERMVDEYEKVYEEILSKNK